MNATDYAPGELIKAMSRSKPVDVTPNGWDILIYVNRCIDLLNLKGPVRLDVNENMFQMGRLTTSADARVVYVESHTGATLFYASVIDGTWVIDVFKEGPWTQTLEYAYDKVVTCRDSMESWVTEFPPIGVVFHGEESDGESKPEG